MRERIGDVFFILDDELTPNAICILTNQNVNANGNAIMGKGIAKQARDKFPRIVHALGKKILEGDGDLVQVITYANSHDLNIPDDKVVALVNFPTKKNFWDNSSLRLVEESLGYLVLLTDKHGWKEVWLPYPGIGCGGLKREDVQPLLEKYLNDRFVICSLR